MCLFCTFLSIQRCSDGWTLGKRWENSCVPLTRVQQDHEQGYQNRRWEEISVLEHRVHLPFFKIRESQQSLAGSSPFMRLYTILDGKLLEDKSSTFLGLTEFLLFFFLISSQELFPFHLVFCQMYLQVYEIIWKICYHTMNYNISF